MKRFLKSLIRYTLITIGALVVCLVVGLLIYYNVRYQKAAVPTNVAALPAVAQPMPAPAKPLLLPVPKKVTWTAGVLKPASRKTITAPPGDAPGLTKLCDIRLVNTPPTGIHFTKDASLSPQAYRLSIRPTGVAVMYNTLQGASYAVGTLKQIIQHSPSAIPCVEIEDEPDLEIRGAMLDVSRGKVPKLETLYAVVDLLADLKYNQLQLYIEGFSFGYPSFRRFWEKTETPLLPEEIRALDAYCRDRYIELVPNQNSLGHMQDWLKQDELKDLAECPEGYKLLGLIEVKTTLSPTDPRTLTLVQQMSADLLPNFTSTQFNVNLDEPFELGKSKQRPISDPKAVAKLYIDYARQLNTYVNSENKTMMMWGDVVSRTPEVIADIPENVTLLEWRYEAIQPFDDICAKYAAANRRYLVCPGTSSWSSFTGRTDNMLHNIGNAVESAVKHKAAGMLITDWGDTPHLQYLPVSYAGLAYAGAMSWNSASKADVPLAPYLSSIVFGDSTGTMGNLALDAGRYNQFEEYPMLAMTTTNFALRMGMMDPVMLDAVKHKLQGGIIELGSFDAVTSQRLTDMFQHPAPYNGAAILGYLAALDSTLSTVKLSRPDGVLVIDEYRNNIRMARAATLLKQYMLHHLELPDDVNRKTLEEIKHLCATIMPEHERLWMARNKRSGLAASTESLRKLEADVNTQLARLDANVLSRGWDRTKEKLISAAAAVFLR